MNMNVLLFGAGDAGERVFQIIDRNYRIVSFVDNDSQKHGKTVCGKSVIPPTKICEYEYDLIIVSNVHGDAVRNQLVHEFNVPESKIKDFFNQDLNDARAASLKMAAHEIYDAGVKGNVAELGVYRGDFAVRINELFPDRMLYLFDTFEGFNAADIEIDERNGLSSSQKGDFYYSDIDSILERMPFADKCIVRKGFFPESAADVNDCFAFVSLDVDLYQPTIEGLKYFFPRMMKGGYIFVHDYNSIRFQGVKKAVREFCGEENVSYFPLHDISGSVVIAK